jgi:hypothetical protein
MILERTTTEILVRLPSTVDLSELQDMLDYLKYKELSSSTNAKQSDVDELSKIINKSMWSNLKEKRKLK